MAQKTHIQLIDDLDNRDADETITFGLDGVTYEIDLHAENATRLRADLAEYVANARKTGAGKQTARPSKSTEHFQTVREWARKRGLKVSSRGRIPADILKAYNNQDQDAAPAVVHVSAPVNSTHANTVHILPTIPASAGVQRVDFASV
jgi:hypothetical protein